MAARPRVVIVGAGFAGVFAARELAGAPCDVLVLDRNNAHAFLPLLYQVATAAVEAAHIAAPVRAVIRALGRRAANLDFLMAEARGVDFAARRLLAVDQEGREHALPYDYLLLAPGSVTNTFGVPGADSRAFSLKNLEEAVRLRNHILRSFEAAAWATDEDARQHKLCFAVVGGGPTGVELAGAMAELMAGSLRRDFPRLGLCRPCVTLIEAGDGLLPGFPDGLRAYAADKLRRLGVDTLVIGGTQYPNCVRGTAVDAMSRDYRVIVVSDACSAQTAQVAEANIADLRGMGIACVPLSGLNEALADAPE